ncbi:unnamed protein product [Paramecium octaurelia]|uniref:Uncharacterized protein n=1 Tax=Paramecium octaurelia TaxID=43137 RepID=A0A8S1YKL6_PAROT|nr:unnamed protein product [Paramecium octaurelia]
MCIFKCSRGSARFLMDPLRYQPLNCELCRKLKKLDNFQFCGRLSILYVNFQKFRSDLLPYLVEIYQKSNHIQCRYCNQKFFLDQKDNHLFVSKFTCSHEEIRQIKQCPFCKILNQRKSYQECKKCKLDLLFFNKYREVQCPCCKIVYCEMCKKEKQLFQQKFCNCRIIKYSKDVILFQFLVIALIFLIILVLIGSNYLEDSEFYQSIKCTIKDGYSNVNCTLEQLFYDTFKQFILFIGITFLISPGVALVEIINLLFKAQRRLSKAQMRRF